MTMNKKIVQDNILVTALRNIAHNLRVHRGEGVSHSRICVDAAGIMWANLLDKLDGQPLVTLPVFIGWVEQAFDADVAMEWARERASYHRHQEHLVGSDDEGDEHDFIVIAP